MNGDPWDLPSRWRWQQFDEVARVASNLVDPALYPSLPHIAPNHIESGTGRLLPYTTVAADGVTSPKHYFRPGHVLYSKIRPYLAKAVFADFEGLCSADMYPIEVGPSLDARFLRWWMLTREFTRRAAGEQARTVLPKINRRSLGSLPVPLPPPEEQRRIVDILEDHLSRLDAAAAYVDSGLASLDLLEQVVLAGSYRAAAELVPLGSVAAIQGGIQKQPKRTPRDNAHSFLRVANVTSRGLDLREVHRIELFGAEIDRYRLQRGDLLVVEGNGSASQIGRAALWDGSIDDCVHQNHLIRVRPDAALLPEFLECLWNSPDNRRRLSSLASSTSGLHTLSVRKLKGLPVPLPDLTTQARAVATVGILRAQQGRLAEELDRTHVRGGLLRRALLEAAFSGRLTGRSSDLGLVEELRGA